ncbi:SUV3 domain-containing protein [Hydrogenimonas sp.]
MGKKKKKLIKYNQAVRKIFGGDGFDEGIVRLPLDNLIELAMILSLKESNLSKADLVRAFRRLWSEGEPFERQQIVEYLKSLDTHFTAEGTVTDAQAREKKLLELLEAIPHTPAEAAALAEAFAHTRLKKITPKKVERALQRIRAERKRGDLEARLEGVFDEEGRFVFFHSFTFDIEGERFGKILALSCPPPGEEAMRTQSLEALAAQIEACKKEAIAEKKREVAQLERLAQAPNRYLTTRERIEAIRRMPESADLSAVPIPAEVLRSILLRAGGCESVEFTARHARLFKEASKELFGREGWWVRYRLMMESELAYLYKAIWHDEALSLAEDFERLRERTEARFDAELMALKEALAHEAEGLGIDEGEIESTIAEALMEAIGRSGRLEIPYKTLRHIDRRFAKRIEGLKLKKQREELLAKTIRDFKNLFPLAREMKRRLIFHVGPTNSGKTHAAMERLKAADTGYYLAPLRLLALEGYENLLAAGIPASLVTGEEQLLDEEAAHISSTIEMANFQVDVDVCVIDEVQMIADPDRGWAWANAIIGIAAKTVVMTGSEEALEAVRELAEWLGEPLEVVRFERKAPLILKSGPTSLKKLEPATAIVAFSRKEVLALRERLAGRYDVSVVYGNLSPEVRREEARRFREGQTQILVATDAIAMGLNLPIKTLLFARDSKFDGQSRRLLTPSEIRQIAGRAGRYGLHEEGFVGALSESVLRTVAERIDEPAEPIRGPYRVMANLEHIELVSQIVETESLSEILGFFAKHMRFDGPFVAANLEDMLEIAKMVDLYRLDLKAKYHLACAPLSLGSAYLESVFHRWLIALERQEPIPFALPEALPETAQTAEMLLEAEERIKEVSLYLWLSYRFPDAFVDTERAMEARERLNAFIERSLRRGAFMRACRLCGKPLPKGFGFGICQSCYKGTHKRRRYGKG